jgi:hypothetical protein
MTIIRNKLNVNIIPYNWGFILRLRNSKLSNSFSCKFLFFIVI